MRSIGQDAVVITKGVIIEGDTMPVIHLPSVTIFPAYQFKSKTELRRFTRLLRNVKKVYPFAKLAGIKFEEYNELLVNVNSEREKKKIMKHIEKDLKSEFEDDLRQLTFTQGRILIKLIDRETSNSSFEIVQEFRGKFVAFFWQSIARIFGYNLKIKYDPKGEDAPIEGIVRRIEAGAI
ncbi:DUF4294 domain-containing protein [Bacteroidota bacterium]